LQGLAPQKFLPYRRQKQLQLHFSTLCLAAHLLSTPCPSYAAASTDSDPVEGITLNEALDRAATQAPDVRDVASQLAVSASDIGVASMLPNPTLTAGGNANSAHFYADVTVPLAVFGQRAAGIKVAEARTNVWNQQLDVVRLDVRLATTLAWLQLWVAQREAEVQSETDTRRQRLVTMAQKRYDAGSASQFEVVRAQSEAARAHAEAIAADALIAAAAARLNGWTSPAASADAQAVRAAGMPQQTNQLPVLSTLLGRIEGHPLLRQTRARAHAAQVDVALEKTLRWPTLGLQFGASILSPAAPEKDLHASLSVELPVFNMRGPLIERAKASHNSALVSRQTTLTRLTAAVAVAHQDLTAAHSRARTQRDDALPLVKTGAFLAVKGYRAGAFDLTSVLAADQALAETQLTSYRAMAEEGRSLAILEHALGAIL
jgi:cobalt-zinc-cadmium efflux system outer membrane protein